MTQDQEGREYQTEGRSVKLVADALEEYRATCEELSRATRVPGTSIFCI